MKQSSQGEQLGIYRHYKGQEYELMGIANHIETLGKMAVYKALYSTEEFGENALWVRPYEMFFESVVIDGKEVPRFEFVKEN